MAGYPHPRNLICENLDLTASREIYMSQKFPGIWYLYKTNKLKNVSRFVNVCASKYFLMRIALYMYIYCNHNYSFINKEWLEE